MCWHVLSSSVVGQWPVEPPWFSGEWGIGMCVVEFCGARVVGLAGVREEQEGGWRWLMSR